MRNLKTVSVIGLLLVAATPPAVAQFSDLLKKGQEMLEGSSGGSGSALSNLSTGEIAKGLKEALRVGSGRVIRQVGRRDGYNADPKIHLPLPDSLQTVQSALKSVGMSGMLDDLEMKLNRAAEVAAPKAKKLFVNAIASMTLDDAKRIYNGPKDSATRYFKGKMTKPLAREMAPVVNRSLSQVGAIKSYDNVMGQYKQLPFVPDAAATHCHGEDICVIDRSRFNVEVGPIGNGPFHPGLDP